MKDIWKQRYLESRSIAEGEYIDVLTGFNANIDITYNTSNLDLKLETVDEENLGEINSYKEFKSLLKYCIENGENKEVEKTIEEDFENGIEQIGGQGAIMANYLSNINNSVIFYTPFLSDRLAEKMNEDILYPVFTNEFVLKNVRDAPNTDRTKENLIFEFSEDKTGRVILSDKIKGFGPYFRGGVEENFSKMDNNLDRILLSGFHNIEGNIDSKLKKAKEQLKYIDTPIHLEYVDMDEEISKKIMDNIFPYVDSVGFDEFEAKEIAKIKNIDIEDELTLGDAFELSKSIIENHGLDRVHIHTYRYQVLITKDSYPVEKDKLRSSILFGCLSAVTMADNGFIPRISEIKDFNGEKTHVKNLDDLENFADFFDLDDFVESGIAEIQDYKVVAAPTLIHEEPKKLVGMGDIISAGAFVSELK